MKRVYLAARYGRRKEIQNYAIRLENIGVIVTSRWVNGEHESLDNNMTHQQAREFALDDLADIRDADTLIAFTEHPTSMYSRGGRHVEFGYALALCKNIVIIGTRENIFYHLYMGLITQYDSFEAFMMAVFVDDMEVLR